MSRFFYSEKNHFLLFGDTYTVRERIKTSGGRWDSKRKAWRLIQSPESLATMQELGFLEKTDIETTFFSPPESHQSSSAMTLDGQEITLSVTELNLIIQKLLQSSFTESLWVTGEISSFRRSGKHAYFDLADLSDSESKVPAKLQRTQSLSCVIWQDKLEKLLNRHSDFPFSDGLKVRLKCSVDYRKDNGKINLIVEDWDKSYSEGNIALNRQKIVAELRQRQLYDKNKRHTWPFFGLRIGLITAHQSRAYSDFINELERTSLPFKITVYDVHMQGPKTSDNVCRALQSIFQGENFDCIVITRGGGSRLDLRWFDDLEICKQIAYSKVPVVCAIGHFDDISVADEVAFKAEKTPTGAARFLVEKIEENKNQLKLSFDEISRKAQSRLTKELEKITRLKTQLVTSSRIRFKQESTKLEHFLVTLRLLKSSIDKISARGFGLLRDFSGNAIHPRDLEQFLEKELFLDFRYKDRATLLNKRVNVVLKQLSCTKLEGEP